MTKVRSAAAGGHRQPAGDLSGPTERIFDAVCPLGDTGAFVGVSIGVGRNPATGRGWYWAAVAGPDRSPTVVVDADVTLPPRPGSLEFRSPGLWADHTSCAPGGQWTVGLEAFGVVLDDPWLAWGRAFGERTPMGADMDWDPVEVPAGGAQPDDTGVWNCRVAGELLVGAQRHELDGVGVHTAAAGDTTALTPGHLWGWWREQRGEIVHVDCPSGAPGDPTDTTWVVTDPAGAFFVVDLMGPAPVLVGTRSPGPTGTPVPLMQALVVATPCANADGTGAVGRGGGPGWIRYWPW